MTKENINVPKEYSNVSPGRYLRLFKFCIVAFPTARSMYIKKANTAFAQFPLNLCRAIALNSLFEFIMVDF